jgi:hypothetical protein
MYIYIYIYVYINMYTYINTHTYIHTPASTKAWPVSFEWQAETNTKSSRNPPAFKRFLKVSTVTNCKPINYIYKYICICICMNIHIYNIYI